MPLFFLVLQVAWNVPRCIDAHAPFQILLHQDQRQIHTGFYPDWSIIDWAALHHARLGQLFFSQFVDPKDERMDMREWHPKK